MTEEFLQFLLIREIGTGDLFKHLSHNIKEFRMFSRLIPDVHRIMHYNDRYDHRDSEDSTVKSFVKTCCHGNGDHGGRMSARHSPVTE